MEYIRMPEPTYVMGFGAPVEGDGYPTGIALTSIVGMTFSIIRSIV
jgi:hypothetical protein